jgi:hypothetical protein
MKNQPEPPPTPTEPYNRAAIFDQDGPFSPLFMRESVRTLFRALPLDQAEPVAWQHRRMYSALLGLSALHPRDEIEVMLGVQALSAYHAAAANWRIGMNLKKPNGDSTRHITTAANAARTFDAMLKAIERRQAKPLAIPVGRPAAKVWDEPHPTIVIDRLAEDCRKDQAPPKSDLPPAPKVVWTQEDLAIADAFIAKRKRDKENEGLDIANTDGILPGGGMILPENPTPQQEAYMGRRLALMYRREYEEGLKKGIKTMPKIRPIRAGDLIP